MPVALTLRLDDAGIARVQPVLDALETLGIVSSVRRLGYPPHVTLAVWDDEPEPERVRGLLADWGELEAGCPALGMFAGPPVTMFIAVTPTSALLQRQAALVRAMPGHVVHPHYRPGAWMPHVTMADDVDPVAAGAACSIALSSLRPFVSKLARVDCVRFPPAQVLWSAGVGRG